jgi:nucleotide-binding universal stress UspA family protein
MIPRIKNILYATDLSKNSAYAFRYAINSAQKHDAQIHILHVIETVPPSTEGLLGLVLGHDKLEKIRDETKESLIRRIENRLAEFAKRELKDDPDTLKRVATIMVRIGDPAEEILKKAEETNCDIVIMGTHGKGLIEHTFLGSVSEKVLHRISKPVYIIPLPKGETDITLGEI